MAHDIDLNVLIRERAPFQNLRVRVPTTTGMVLLSTTFKPYEDEPGGIGSQPALRLIHDLVCQYFGLQTLRNAKRGRVVSYPRQIAMAISANYASTPEVGRFYKRDHSTVLYAVKQAKDNRLISDNARKLAKEVEAALSGKGKVL
jgi:chromosomal replication initiation ATPase DnaA